MKRQAFASILLLCGLAACGGEGSAPDDRRKGGPVTMRNKAHEQLRALPEDKQRIGLRRAIRDTGNRCPLRVESARYQQQYEELAMWTARCSDNGQWAVFIAANEDVQVRNCEQMERLRLPRCAELPPAPPQLSRPKSKAS